MRELEKLDERAIIKTADLLRNRVVERVPERGLAKITTHLLDLARLTASEAGDLRQPYWGMRLVSVVAIIGGIAGFALLYRFFRIIMDEQVGLAEFTQGLEATLNIILISGLVIGFFLRLENRRKRTIALSGLYRLRAVAHVIDMHQLTKDPAIIVGTHPTTSSPLRGLNSEELLLYLDYCTEMLSLTSKLAALYAQYFPDATVVAAARATRVQLNADSCSNSLKSINLTTFNRFQLNAG